MSSLPPGSPLPVFVALAIAGSCCVRVLFGSSSSSTDSSSGDSLQSRPSGADLDYICGDHTSRRGINAFGSTSLTKKVPSTDMVWVGRPKQVIHYLGQESKEITVYRTDFFGTTLNPGFWDLIDTQAWESSTFHVIKSYMDGHSDQAYIDFGAWIGPTVLYASFFSDHLFALEPDPLAFSALVANINANPRVAKKAKVYFECISAGESLLTMTGSGDSTSRLAGSSSSSSSRSLSTTSAVSSWSVKCRSLPQFIQEENVPRVRLIKMDTEGAERFILPALKPWLQSFETRNDIKPAIWLSMHIPYWDAASVTDAKKKEIWGIIGMYKYVYTEGFTLVDTSPALYADLCKVFCGYLLSDEPFVLKK